MKPVNVSSTMGFGGAGAVKIVMSGICVAKGFV